MIPSRVLMIKECCMIGQEALDDLLHAKKLRYQLILSRDIDDQRALQSRHNWPHLTRKGSLRCYLSLMTNSKQKTKILIDSFLRYLWSKILQSCKSCERSKILIGWECFSHNWRTRFFTDMWLLQHYKEHCYQKKTHQWIKFLAKSRNLYFGWIFFSQKK